MKLENMTKEELEEMKTEVDKQLETFINPIDNFKKLQNEIRKHEEKIYSLENKQPKFIGEINYFISDNDNNISIIGGEKRKNDEIEKFEGVILNIKSNEIICDLNRHNKPSDEISKIIEDYFDTKIIIIQKKSATIDEAIEKMDEALDMKVEKVDLNESKQAQKSNMYQ